MLRVTLQPQADLLAKLWLIAKAKLKSFNSPIAERHLAAWATRPDCLWTSALGKERLKHIAASETAEAAVACMGKFELFSAAQTESIHKTMHTMRRGGAVIKAVDVGNSGSLLAYVEANVAAVAYDRTVDVAKLKEAFQNCMSAGAGKYNEYRPDTPRMEKVDALLGTMGFKANASHMLTFDPSTTTVQPGQKSSTASSMSPHGDQTCSARFIIVGCNGPSVLEWRRADGKQRVRHQYTGSAYTLVHGANSQFLSDVVHQSINLDAKGGRIVISIDVRPLGKGTACKLTASSIQEIIELYSSF